MSPDESIFLPTTGEDDSFLLSAKMNLASPTKLDKSKISASSNGTNQMNSRNSKRSSGLEDGQRRTAEIVARLQKEREQRQAGAKPSALRTKIDPHQDREDGTEWEDVQEVTENVSCYSGRSRAEKTTHKHRMHISGETREDSIAALKQRIAEARARREPATADKVDYSGEPNATVGSSVLRNNAFARIMNRPERSKVSEPVILAKASPAEKEAKQEQTRDSKSVDVQYAESPAQSKVPRISPCALETERGNRMIEKLMGPASKSQAWRVTPQETTDPAVGPITTDPSSSDPACAPSVQSHPVTVLERIEETLREEMNTTVEVTPSINVQEATAVVQLLSVECPPAVVLVDASNDPTSAPELEQTQPADLPDIPVDTVIEPIESKNVDKHAVQTDRSIAEVAEDHAEDSCPTLPQTPVRIIVEPDHSNEACSDQARQPSPSEKMEQEWIDEEMPATLPVPNAVTANNNLQSIFPISVNNARLASMLLPVQAQAGPSSTARVANNTAIQNLSRFPRTTLPRTPTFARVKRRAAKDSPVKRVPQSRLTAKPASRPVYPSIPVQREELITSKQPTAIQPRAALANMSLSGHNVATRNKPSLPVVEGIARKPSSIVQIPDFSKAHKAVEIKTKRLQPRLTRPEPGRTPGRTSRARMLERAEFDKANRDYQSRREEALKRYKQEKEEAAWAAEMELRSAIAFKANPVPDFIRSTRS